MPSSELRSTVLTVTEACKYIRHCKTKLYALMQAGEISYKQAGRRRLIYVASLDKYLASLPDR